MPSFEFDGVDATALSREAETNSRKVKQRMHSAPCLGCTGGVYMSCRRSAHIALLCSSVEFLSVTYVTSCSYLITSIVIGSPGVRVSYNCASYELPYRNKIGIACLLASECQAEEGLQSVLTRNDVVVVGGELDVVCLCNTSYMCEIRIKMAPVGIDKSLPA